MEHNDAEFKRLRSEITNLFNYICRMREEVARTQMHEGERNHFETMSEHLDAIVGATEEATDTILDNLEGIDRLASLLKDTAPGNGVASLCQQISNKAMNAVEACTFQDITGQRVSRILRSIRFVEERVAVMVDLLGRHEVENVGAVCPLPAPLDPDAALLNGPALPGESVAQEDIDKLFA